MPVRPRHCIGHTNARSLHHWLVSREGERRGPEPGDDSTLAPRFRTSGEGLVASEASTQAR